MNTIAIDSNIYKGAESYAKLHNISVTAAIEKAISLFLQKVQPKQKLPRKFGSFTENPYICRQKRRCNYEHNSN